MPRPRGVIQIWRKRSGTPARLCSECTMPEPADMNWTEPRPSVSWVPVESWWVSLPEQGCDKRSNGIRINPNAYSPQRSATGTWPLLSRPPNTLQLEARPRIGIEKEIQSCGYQSAARGRRKSAARGGPAPSMM